MAAPFASRQDVHKLVNLAEKGKNTVAKIKEKAAETMETAVSVLEVSAASFGFGYARGRYATTGGEFAVMGVPPDLLAGVVLHGLGFLGAFGPKYDSHAHQLGNGALAAFLTTKGVQFGVEARSKDPTSKYGPLLPGKTVVGADGYPAIGAGAMRMTDADLAREIARATS
jgi:hypothetical protein